MSFGRTPRAKTPAGGTNGGVMPNRTKHPGDVFTVRKLPASLKKWRWDINGLERTIRQKMTAHTPRSTDQVRNFCSIFGASHGITKDVFRRRLRVKFSIVLTDDEVDALFDRYDTKNTGTIDLVDMLNAMLEPDVGPKVPTLPDSSGVSMFAF